MLRLLLILLCLLACSSARAQAILKLWDPAYVAVRPGASIEVMVIARGPGGLRGDRPRGRGRDAAAPDPAVSARPPGDFRQPPLSCRARDARRCRSAQGTCPRRHAAHRGAGHRFEAGPARRDDVQGELRYQACMRVALLGHPHAAGQAHAGRAAGQGLKPAPGRAPAGQQPDMPSARGSRPQQPDASRVYSPRAACSTAPPPLQPRIYRMRTEVHVHGTVPLRSGVTLSQLEAAMQPWLDYLDVEGIDELKSVHRDEPGIVFDPRRRLLEVCWTGDVGRNFRKIDRGCPAGPVPVRRSGHRNQLSYYHEDGRDEISIMFVGPTSGVDPRGAAPANGGGHVQHPVAPLRASRRSRRWSPTSTSCSPATGASAAPPGRSSCPPSRSPSRRGASTCTDGER